ncbi:MAG: HtaA domain-containing protein [Miltoncostaeaceae bacterium]
MLALLLSVALIAAACGDDDDDDATTADEVTTLTLTGAQTTLALDADTAAILTDNGIEVAPVDPATAGDDGISFPITGGEVDADTLAGTINHSGGLAFTAGGTTLELTDFVIDTTAGTLTATAGGDQVVILDVDLTGLQRTDGDDGIELTGITTTLSQDGADALNATFDVELFEQGIAIGNVTVLATA